MTFDLEINETGNGGDIVLIKNDLSVVNGIENQPYLGMFGGNVEAITAAERANDAKDYWGNNLLMQADATIQFNSIVEKTLNTVPLTSSGRVIIEDAIKQDLQFLSPLATIKVVVTIVATDRINVDIKISTDIGKEQNIKIGFALGGDGDWVIEDFNNDFNI